MSGMNAATANWSRERSAPELWRCNDSSILKLFSRSGVVHVGCCSSQEVTPYVEVILHGELILDALEQSLAQCHDSDDFFAELVDQVPVPFILR